MTRIRILLLYALLALSTPAAAQNRYIGWGDGKAGSPYATPDCNDLPPTHTLVVSFDLPAGVTTINRIEAFVDYCTDPFPLLEWWSFQEGGGCRADSLRVSADFTQGPFTAVDPWGGQAEIVWSYYPAWGGNAVLARVLVSITPPGGAVGPLQPGQEYYAFKLEFGNPPQGCGGCEQAACFVLNGLSIEHPGGILYTNMNYFDEYAQWQNPLDCPFIVPTRPTTWGLLKNRDSTSPVPR